MQGTGMNFLEGAMRGGAAALRGYMEAKVAVAQARNDADRQSAMSALARERNRLLQVKQNQDFWLGQQQKESAERMHAETQQTARQQITTDHEGRIYIVDAQNNTATELKKIDQAIAKGQNQTAETVAGIQAQTAESVATTQAQSAENVAGTQAQSAESVATTQAGAVVDSAEIAAKAQQAVAEIQQEIATAGYASKERVAELEANLKSLGFLGLGGRGLDKDGWGRLNDMLTRVTANKDLTRIRHIRSGYITAMQGIVDAAQIGPLSQQLAKLDATSPEAITLKEKLVGLSMADMAIINGYQRMIDPGATVREGDVDALVASMAKSEQFRTFVNQFLGSGGKFTPEGRKSLATLVLGQYNANIDSATGLNTQLQTLLDASGLQRSGFDMSFFNLPRREDRSVDQIIAEGLTPRSGGATSTPQGDGKVASDAVPDNPQETGQQPDGGAAPRAMPDKAGSNDESLQGVSVENVNMWREAYIKGRESGITDEQLDTFLAEKVAKGYPNLSEQQVSEGVAEIRKRADAFGEGKRLGHLRSEINEGKQKAKIMAPELLQTSDLADETIYRELKIKYAPEGGFKSFDEQAWNRAKGAVYESLINDGASQAVARAFVMKLRGEIEGSDQWRSEE